MAVLAVLIIAILPDAASAAERTGGLLDGSSALSINNETLSKGTGIKSFDEGFMPIVKGWLSVLRPVTLILTSMAGMMIALGIQDGTKTVWNWTLGISLAMCFADVFYNGLGFGALLDETSSEAVRQTVPEAFDMTGEKNDVISQFFGYYKSVIYNGSKAIVPFAASLLCILTVLNASVQVALDLISGDKIKYLLTQTLKAGFIFFLITHWLGTLDTTYNTISVDIMSSMEAGFQEIGYRAGGVSDGALETGPDGVTLAEAKLKPDSIWENGFVMFDQQFKALADNVSLMHPINSLINVIFLLFVVIVTVLISIEFIMAKIEFYTIALLTLPCLPFGMLKQTEFLFQASIKAMFNLSLKLMVLAFLQAIIIPSITSLNESVCSSQGLLALSEMIKTVLGLLVLYMLVKKIPALCTSLLNGTPSLSGGDMKQMGMQAIHSGSRLAGQAAPLAAHAAGKAIRGGQAGYAWGSANTPGPGAAKMAAGAVTMAAGAMAGGVGGFAAAATKSLGQAVITNNPVTRGVTQGINSMVGNGSHGGYMNSPFKTAGANPAGAGSAAGSSAAGSNNFGVNNSAGINYASPIRKIKDTYESAKAGSSFMPSNKAASGGNTSPGSGGNTTPGAGTAATPEPKTPNNW